MSAAGRGCRIFFSDEYLGVAPTVLNLARALSERGYATELYVGARDEHYPDAGLPRGVRIVDVRIPEKLALHRSAAVDSRRLHHQDLQFPLGAFEQAAANPRSAFNIGVDNRGGIAARWRQQAFGEPYAYLSLELPNPPKESVFAQLNHAFKRDAYQHAAALIVQDDDRAAVLEQRFGAGPARRFLVPNGPPDVPPPLKLPPEENYFRRKFGLSKERHPWLVAQVGMILPPVYPKQLAAAARGVPEFTFIFHERRQRSPEERDIAEIRAINPENLHLSLEPVPYERIAEVYASIDIGIAYYEPRNDDFSNIALASGKLAFYLRHGVPVVINSLPSLLRLNEKYGFAAVVNDPASPSELAAALRQVTASYERYSQNARRCFLEEIEFGRRTRPLFDFFGTL